MADPLDEQLASLSDVPVRLAPAEQVRRRGEQRRARVRAVATGSVLTVLALLAGVAIASGPTQRDSLQPVPFASAESTVPAEAALLLEPRDAEEVSGGTWTVQSEQESSSPLLTACDEAPVGAAAVSGAARTLAGALALRVRSQVLSYPDEARATGAWKEVLLEIERCPQQIDDGELLGRVEVEQSLPAPGTTRVYVTATSRECGDCMWRSTHFSLAPVGAHLVVVQLDGLLHRLPALAETAEARVRCGGGCGQRPTPQARPTSRPGSSLTDAFLPPEQAAQATDQPGWRVDERSTPDATPFADPCGEGTTALAADVVAGVERAMGEEREYAGSSLLQEVYRYSSPATAHEAYLAYVDRYRRCADAPDPSGAAGDTIRSELIGPQDPPYGDGELIRRIPCISGSCVPHFSTYVLVARVGDVLSVVGYSVREDRDPTAEASRLLQAVADHLTSVIPE